VVWLLKSCRTIFGKVVNVFVMLHCLVALDDKFRVPLISFLGALAELGKVTFSFFMCVCPPAWNSPTPTGRILMKLVIGIFFENLWRKFTFH
jgi:hypothetical protein